MKVSVFSMKLSCEVKSSALQPPVSMSPQCVLRSVVASFTLLPCVRIKLQCISRLERKRHRSSGDSRKLIKLANHAVMTQSVYGNIER